MVDLPESFACTALFSQHSLILAKGHLFVAHSGIDLRDYFPKGYRESVTKNTQCEINKL